MSMDPRPALPEAVRALAQADFAAFMARFSAAGFAAASPAPGVLTVKAANPSTARASVLVSVGVHGDETGPIEMVAYVLDALAAQPAALAVDLMLCVGNIDAIARGKRFIDADLNRMFRANRGDLAGTAEAARADVLIDVTRAFFEGSSPERWHLDLHTAIRRSHYPAFAIVPELLAPKAHADMLDWLGEAEIGAVIMNPSSAGTYSYYTSEHLGTTGSTVELGRVGTLGQNDLAQFAGASRALDRLLRGLPPQPAKAAPHVFSTAQSIMKLSDAFTMTVGRETWNFTPLKKGEVIAVDGDTTYTVKHDEELVVFPNPDVRVGLRAGIMVVRIG